VAALMQMSAADGLYHKAIIQSGLIKSPAFFWPTAEDSARWTEQLLEQTGGLGSLLSRPVNQLMQCCRKAYPNQMFWLPTQGAGTFIGDHTIVGLRPETRQIPVILGSALCEFGMRANFIDKSRLSEGQKLAALTDTYGERAAAVKALFEQTYPDVNSVYAAHMDFDTFRALTVNYCGLRAAMDAPTWSYLLTYEAEFSGGYMSYHGAELPFTFHNLDSCPAVYSGERTWTFQDEIFGAWMRFAHTGDPNHEKLPVTWQPYTEAHHACMIFGASAVCREDHDRELLAYLLKTAG
jgi:para-nitrobenzyl esterase